MDQGAFTSQWPSSRRADIKTIFPNKKQVVFSLHKDILDTLVDPRRNAGKGIATAEELAPAMSLWGVFYTYDAAVMQSRKIVVEIVTVCAADGVTVWNFFFG